jgi:hypothetical protein
MFNNIPTMTALIPIYFHLFGFTLPHAFRMVRTEGTETRGARRIQKGENKLELVQS